MESLIGFDVNYSAITLIRSGNHYSLFSFVRSTNDFNFLSRFHVVMSSLSFALRGRLKYPKSVSPGFGSTSAVNSTV